MKVRIRANVRALRRSIPPEQRSRDAESLADKLLSIPAFSRAQLVLGYGANAEEIDPEPALIRMREAGARIAYPRVSGHELDLHTIAVASELEFAAFGILEPAPDAPRVRAQDIEAVLVPAVVFDREGYRLGYGGGFYDRFLERLPPTALIVGIAFDEQLVDELPREAHDRPVDLVVTPSVVLDAARKRTGTQAKD